MNPSLFFTMPLGYYTRLITGNLRLDYGDGEAVVNYLATSGAVSRQTKELFWKRGQMGPIPPGQYHIPTIGYVSNHPGIAGMFFHIQPDPSSSEGGRSELGIHWDARSPGTAGCIGIIRQSSFEKFCDRLEELAEKGVMQIPLLVRY